jgi:hypothetical protein
VHHHSARLRLGGVALASLLAVVSTVGVASSGPSSAATASPTLTVDATAGAHPISPLIYGMNSYGVDQSLATELRIPIERWGGDATTRYNWQQDSSNSGSDWYFMSGSGVANPTPSAGPDALERKDQATGGTTDMTIPVIPWINSSSAANCSFPTTVYGPQQAVDPYLPTCGNGLTTAAQPITDTDIGRNNTANSPAFEAAWVQHLVQTFGTAAEGGVDVYQLDNEPSGWNNTHRDVHPAQTGWDELINLSEQYAAAIKGADPTAAIDGPGDFGWPAYFDDGAPGDNKASHGGQLWQAQYYLQQMAHYQQQHGTRLLDYFDEHYYPTTPTGLTGCIALCEEGDSATQTARLEATRSLWDPTFVENDWIGQYYGDIDLIPRMKSWINQYYPGTKTAITEYNFGALDSMNGALAQADALGIFGAQGLDMADLWSPPSTSQPGAFTFRMYRDYDGKGSGFGDTSVPAESSDQSQLSVYGATRHSDGALTVMVVNKTGVDLTSPLAIANFSGAAAAQAYTYDAANPTAIVQQPNAAVTNGTITRDYSADSITLLVIPKSGTAICPQSAGSQPLPGVAGMASIVVNGCRGYWIVSPAGQIRAFGAAESYGDLSSVSHLDAPIIAITASPDGRGYYLLGADGGVFTFGDARFYGSTGGVRLNAPVVSMASTPSGNGYLIVAKDGGIFTFGDAHFYGSTGDDHLAQPVDGISVAPNDTGYRLVAADGGVFSFGAAPFYGSLGSVHLNKPIIGMASTPDGHGYTLVGSDGGIFAFGDATFFGSLGSVQLTSPIVALAETPDNAGYYLLGGDGGVFTFGAGASYFGGAN